MCVCMCVCVCVCVRNGDAVDVRVLRLCDGMDSVSWREIGGCIVVKGVLFW